MPIFSTWKKKEDKQRVPVQDNNRTTDALPIQKEKYGLFVLTETEPPQQFNVDIVAVHGLGGEWDTTWKDGEKFWLRDFLPLDLPRARIMSYGYDAGTAFSKAVTDISDVAASLLDRLDNGRQQHERKRPVIFIAHSLGGIIVKKALIHAHDRSSHYGDLLDCVKAVVFFGVPHRGADLAYWATFASKILQITQLTTNTNFVTALQKNSPAFRQISEQFIERGANLQIKTFYETEVLYNQLIVDRASAVLGLANEIAVGLEGANHISMCKFSDPKSQKYLQVSKPIKKLVDSITSYPVPALGHDQSSDEFGIPRSDHLKVNAYPVWSNKDGWELVGGNFPPGSKVSVVSRKPGHLDIFALSDKGNIYTTSWGTDNHQSSVQNNWKSLGGSFVPGTKVSVIVRTGDHLDLFACSTDQHVYTLAIPFGLSDLNTDWRSIGGSFPPSFLPGATVAALTRKPNQQDLFLCNNKGSIYTSWWSLRKDWSGIDKGWSSMGGGIFPPGSTVSAFSRAPDHLDLFVCALDGRVYTASWTRTSGWSGTDDYWMSLGGFFPPGAEVSVLSRKPGQLDLFVCGSDGSIYSLWWSIGMGWSGISHNWNSLGGSFVPGAKVSVLSYTPDQLEVFTCGKDGHIYASHWYNKSTVWSSNGDGWVQMGGSFPAGVEVSAIARTPNNLDLFACGVDGHVYSMSWRV